MSRSIALGLAMLAGTVIGAIAINGLHAQKGAGGVRCPRPQGHQQPRRFQNASFQDGRLRRPYCLIGRSVLAFLSHDDCPNSDLLSKT